MYILSLEKNLNSLCYALFIFVVKIMAKDIAFLLSECRRGGFLTVNCEIFPLLGIISNMVPTHMIRWLDIILMWHGQLMFIHLIMITKRLQIPRFICIQKTFFVRLLPLQALWYIFTIYHSYRSWDPSYRFSSDKTIFVVNITKPIISTINCLSPKFTNRSDDNLYFQCDFSIVCQITISTYMAMCLLIWYWLYTSS